jgi:hypothetical protein
MASVSLLQDILDVIIAKCNESVKKITQQRYQENFKFFCELDNVLCIWNILMQLKTEKHPRINHCNLVQCAIYNRLYQDFRIAPMDISYFELESNPPQWLLALAARNRSKRAAELDVC